MFKEDLYNQKMTKTFDVFVKELASLRTGRANASMLDIIKVDVYGQKMPVNQLATISTPDPRSINVQVWDKNNIDAVMKAIQLSDLGINPSSDSDFIKVPIPPLTEERRMATVFYKYNDDDYDYIWENQEKVVKLEEKTQWIAFKKNYFSTFILAEDDLAAMGMTIGANWNGARAFTATSGPGVSLMSEFIGLAYFAEVPAVLFNVQRGGPSTGMPTRTQQSDLLSCAYASHGDTKHIMLIPSDPKECFEFAVEAFDLAERYQTPVIVLLDLDLGMNDWSSKEFQWNDLQEYDRGKVLSKEDLDEIEEFGRYLDVDGDGVPYRTYPGTHPQKGAYFTRGTSHDEYARYTEDGVKNAEILSRLTKKFQTASLSLIHI